MGTHSYIFHNSSLAAFYFSIITMPTVGVGDITPVAMGSRFFSASNVFLGITIFATSINAVIRPIIRGHFQNLINLLSI